MDWLWLVSIQIIPGTLWRDQDKIDAQFKFAFQHMRLLHLRGEQSMVCSYIFWCARTLHFSFARQASFPFMTLGAFVCRKRMPHTFRYLAIIVGCGKQGPPLLNSSSWCRNAASARSPTPTRPLSLPLEERWEHGLRNNSQTCKKFLWKGQCSLYTKLSVNHWWQSFVLANGGGCVTLVKLWPW